MRKVTTVCSRDCYDTCFIVATVNDDGRVVSVKGDRNNPITQTFTCPRGARDADRVYRNRVLSPHFRIGPKPGRTFKRSTWEGTLDLVAKRLKDVIDDWGPERVLLLDYAGNTGLLASAFPQRLWNSIGATRTDYGLCSKSGHEGLSLHYGLSYGVQPEELSEKKLIVYWGFNAAVSFPHIWALSLKARHKLNVKIAVVDPRKSETANQADLWIRPKPGSDVALANGIARYLIQNDLVDIAFIRQWTDGFEAFKREVIKWTPDRVEGITGLDWSSIEKLAIAYGELSPSATMIGVGFQKSFEGAESVRATSLLPALLGQHRGFFYSNGPGYCVDISYLTGESFVDNPHRIVTQVGVSDLIKRGDFKFIYIHGMNPALTLPNQKAFRNGISRDDVFIVVHETHWTETADFADVVFPAQTYLEKEDIVIPWAHQYIRKSNRVVAPLGESRHEIDIMTELARRLGLVEDWLFEDPWKALAKSFDNALVTGTFKDLLDNEIVRIKCKPRNKYQTPTERIEFFSKKAEATGYSPFPEYIPIHLEDGEFILLNSSLRKYTHTQFQEVYGPIPAIVLINPGDASVLGLADDDIITLLNDLGKTKVKVSVSENVPEGVLWSPKELTGLDSNPLNSLSVSVPQRIGGGSVFNSTVVRIRVDSKKEKTILMAS